MTKTIGEREIALAVLLEITEEGAYSHVVLHEVLNKYQYLEKKERSFITRTVEGTLEHLLELDYIIDSFSKTKTRKMKPVIRCILRMSVYQLKYMDSVPAHAVCNEAVKLAVRKGFSGLKGFVNGVLRSVARNLDTLEYPDRNAGTAYLSIRYSVPEWIVDLWRETYSFEMIEQMLQDFQKEKPLTIRCNQRKICPEELEKRLAGEGVSAVRHPYLDYAFQISGFDHLAGLPSFQDGDFSVQDISSMLVGHLAASGVQRTGISVIDVCAAPGGKALHVAELLDGIGHVEARDLTGYKVGLIEENIRRSGLHNISARQQDASVLDENSEKRADIVIADLPCSGLGVLGRKPDLRYKMTKKTAEELAALQKEILRTVQDYVKPGGVLIYSTCTIHALENEDNVHWFLKEFPEFSLTDITEELPDALRSDVREKGMLQLLPGVHQSDGFFLAKFSRRNEKAD